MNKESKLNLNASDYASSHCDSDKDEKIRKALINIFATHKDYEIFSGESVEDILAWLERQGEPKTLCDKCRKEHPSHSCQDITALGRCAVEHEQKPIKSKFHKGDWIVFNGLTLLIEEVVQGYYRTVSIGGIHNSYDWSIDNIARLWTLQDARVGNVLTCYGSKKVNRSSK